MDATRTLPARAHARGSVLCASASAAAAYAVSLFFFLSLSDIIDADSKRPSEIQAQYQLNFAVFFEEHKHFGISNSNVKTREVLVLPPPTGAGIGIRITALLVLLSGRPLLPDSARLIPVPFRTPPTETDSRLGDSGRIDRFPPPRSSPSINPGAFAAATPPLPLLPLPAPPHSLPSVARAPAPP
jgi:hypothetical protein